MSSNIIKISRSKYIEEDRHIAWMRLNMAQHYVGQPIMVRYYVDAEKTQTDTLYAIGIKNGIGEDCYKVISLGGLNIITDVVYELPDVSDLTHGELYLYKDPDTEQWCYVYVIDNERQIEPIVGDYAFANLADKYTWFYKDGVLKREDDFYAEDEIDKIIVDLKDELLLRITALEDEVKKHHDWLVEIDKEVWPLSVTFTNKTGTLFLTGTTQNITFNVVVMRKGESVVDDCTFTLNGETITLDDDGNYTKTGVTTTTTFKLGVKYTPLDMTGSGSNTVTFGYNFYYGIIPASGWTVSESNVKALGNTKLQAKTNTTYIMNLNSQKLAFACPKIYGKLTHIYDANQFDYIAEYDVSEVNINGYDYYVYVKKTEVTITNFRQVYTY